MYRFIIALIMSLALAACGGESQEPGPAAPAPEATGQVAPAPQPGAGATAYTGAVIWDGTGGAAHQGSALVVRDGRVEGIVTDIPAGAEVVNLERRWIIPGFVNAHGHVSGRWSEFQRRCTLDKHFLIHVFDHALRRQ